MSTFISMLRGINVTGYNKLPMAELRALLEGLKLKNVRTYIQSGNVVFESNSAKGLDKKIAKAILDKYGYTVPVVIRTPEELQSVIKNNPFAKEKNIDLERLYITFLAEEPAKEYLAKTQTLSYPPDRFIVKGREVYLHCPISYGNSKLNNNLFENKLKVSATTRNWKTVNELLKMATIKF